jgi:hypothetical protein
MTQDFTTAAVKPLEPVNPRGGAGLFDVDPAQSAQPLDAPAPAAGDLDQLPDEMEF